MSVVGVQIAFLLGVIQGVFEWLPISSEGNVALALAALRVEPVVAVRLALFLHLGTAMAATAYYREALVGLWGDLNRWTPHQAFAPGIAGLTFLGIATVVSGFVGIAAYAFLLEIASDVAGGTFVVFIGGLLVLTGLIQRFSADLGLGEKADPDMFDAILVGIGQGLAVLPGVSRSGTTLSVLLLRGHPSEAAFRLSFILSIPAAVGAALLTVLEVGGLPGIEPRAALVALGTAAIVGYLTIGVLVRAARRISFWAVCIGIGGLAVLGGIALL